MRATGVSRRWAWVQPAPRSVSRQLLPCHRAGWSCAKLTMQSLPIFSSLCQESQAGESIQVLTLQWHCGTEKPCARLGWDSSRERPWRPHLRASWRHCHDRDLNTLKFLVNFWHCFLFSSFPLLSVFFGFCKCAKADRSSCAANRDGAAQLPCHPQGRCG